MMEPSPGLLVLKAMQNCDTATKIIRKRFAASPRYRDFIVSVLYSMNPDNKEFGYEVIVYDSKTGHKIVSFFTKFLSETYTGDIEANLVLLYNS